MDYYLLLKTKRRKFALLFLALFVGLAIGLSGIIISIRSPGIDLRANEQKYNQAVDAWSNTHREDFEGRFSVRNSNTSNWIPMLADQSIDPINSTDFVLKTYTPLKYIIPISHVIPSQPWATGKVEEISFLPNWTSHFDLTIQTQTMQIRILTPASLKCDPSFSQNQVNETCTSACTEKMGSWDPNLKHCSIFHALSFFCAKVAENGSDWEISDLYGGYGCGADNYWNTSNYSVVFPSSSNFSFSGNIILRSVNDPYILAAHLTEGKFVFSLSTVPKEANAGGFLSFVGFSLVFVMVVVVLAACLHERQKASDEERQPFTRLP